MFGTLELRTSSNKSLASFVVGVLVEVLDEASSEVLSLFFPFASALVGVAWVEDSWVHVRKAGWYFEVEHRNLLGFSLEDRTVEDSVDDTAFQPVFTR